MIRRIAALAVASLLAVLTAAPSGARADRLERLVPLVGPEVPLEVAKLYEQKPVIELVTMGIGSLIWERHGHIALCVRYDDRRDDVCYNYGIGDFRHPLAMGWGFLRGAGSFWVGKAAIADMLWIYHHNDRSIWAQPLPLTPEQKREVIAKLEHDILEPNKFYAYDHFWDNCTTRVRDIIDTATGGKLRLMPEIDDRRTFRDLAREGFFGVETGSMPSWVPLIITDIGMGRVTDRVPTYWERMFLPQYLREAVHKLWNLDPIVRYARKGPPPQTHGPSGRGWCALLILLLTAPAWLTRVLGRFQRTGLVIAVLPYLLLGTVLTALAFVSPLPYVRWNEICLVWFPLDVLLLVLSGERQRRYARARLIMLGAILVLSLVGVLTQPLLMPLLWPLIPIAAVAFLPLRRA
ncbi:MAG: DUF4105 domain-containing protein [Myxococcales bacterium]|nr:DUF4105 domain-containing protein [Myxococcales bacterium]